MAEERFEYKAVWAGASTESGFTRILNAEADRGWRFVGTVESAPGATPHVFLVFERKRGRR